MSERERIQFERQREIERERLEFERERESYLIWPTCTCTSVHN